MPGNGFGAWLKQDFGELIDLLDLISGSAAEKTEPGSGGGATGPAGTP